MSDFNVAFATVLEKFRTSGGQGSRRAVQAEQASKTYRFGRSLALPFTGSCFRWLKIPHGVAGRGLRRPVRNRPK